MRARVSVVGDFNDWDGRRYPMRLRHGAGVWEIFVPGLAPGALTSTRSSAPTGELLPLKADPYAHGRSSRPAPHRHRASVAARLARQAWLGERGAAQRAQRADLDLRGASRLVAAQARGGRPLSHLSRARRAARPLCRATWASPMSSCCRSPSIPFDGSWGYQPIGLFAPTSRFGTPDDFRAFVDACHARGNRLLARLGAGTFPDRSAWPRALRRHRALRACRSAPGLPPRLEHLRSTITAGARSRISCCRARSTGSSEFHIDGLRVDAVASMLYLDYSRPPGEWIPNNYGGRENLEAIAFLRRINELIFGPMPAPPPSPRNRPPGRWCRARPMSAGSASATNGTWAGCTTRCATSRKDPIHRNYHHNDLTFGLLYAFYENFILPLSHDEVVHGKGSLIGKMPGDRWQRFANLRAYYGFMCDTSRQEAAVHGRRVRAGARVEPRHRARLASARRSAASPACSGSCAISTGSIASCRRSMSSTPSPTGFQWIDADDADNSVSRLSAPRPRSARRRRRRRAISRRCRGTTIASACRGRALLRALQHRRRGLRRQRRRQCRRGPGRAAADRTASPESLQPDRLPPLATLIFAHDPASV